MANRSLPSLRLSKYLAPAAHNATTGCAKLLTSIGATNMVSPKQPLEPAYLGRLYKCTSPMAPLNAARLGRHARLKPASLSAHVRKNGTTERGQTNRPINQRHHQVLVIHIAGLDPSVPKHNNRHYEHAFMHA